jgi:hypothetical protein
MMKRTWILTYFLIAIPCTHLPARAADDASNDDPLLITYANGTVKFSFEANLTAFYSDNTYWGAANILLPGSQVDYFWGESFAKGGVRIDHRLSDAFKVYAGASAVVSLTADEDIVGTKDVAALSMDEIYGGVRFEQPGDGGAFLDLSAGSQPYTVGTGMLIGDGAPEGSARGAVTIAPFRAWDVAAIARAGYGNWEVHAFYLDADEIYDPDTYTTLAGGKIEYKLRPNEFFGVVGGTVLESESTYQRAVAGGAGSAIIPDAREGLNFINAYGRFNPFGDQLPGFYVSGDFAYEWNNRIDMEAWGARVGAGYTFADLPFTPTLSYNFHTMSGDDAGTAQYEGFDPLFNSGADWALGGNTALIFGNSNVNVHRIGLNLAITPRDLVGLKYFHIRTNQVQSPIPVDPSYVPPSGLASVQGLSKEISNDFAIDYTRVITKNMFFNAAFLYSKPGTLLERFAGQPLPDWYSATATFTVKF